MSSYEVVKHTAFSPTTPENVWHLWSNLSAWTSWDPGAQSCVLKDGHKFEKGGEALFHPKGAPNAVTLKFQECIPNQGFTDRTDFPFGALIFQHKVERVEGGVNITHTAVFEPTSEQGKGAFEGAFAGKIRLGLPVSVNNIAAQAPAVKV